MGHYDLPTEQEQIDMLRAWLEDAKKRIAAKDTALAEAERENEELRADLAWAVKRDAGLEGDGADGMAVCYYGTNSIASAKFIDFDGTDADLCRAIREARRGE